MLYNTLNQSRPTKKRKWISINKTLTNKQVNSDKYEAKEDSEKLAVTGIKLWTTIPAWVCDSITHTLQIVKVVTQWSSNQI